MVPGCRSESLCPVPVRRWPSFRSPCFQVVDSDGCRTEDVCALVGAEGREVVAEKLPPLHVVRGYEAHGPIGACQQAIGAECANYSVQIWAQRIDRPVRPGVLRYHAGDFAAYVAAFT